jgi:SSS family solute:Na+ symporter
LFSAWMHRWALIAGLVVGLGAGIVLLYQLPQLGPDGAVVRPHFGGSAWPLAEVGITGGYSVYAGLVALVLNIGVAVLATPVLRLLRIRDGRDLTWRRDYVADEGDAEVRRLDEILDGRPVARAGSERPGRHAASPTERVPPPRGTVYHSR